MKAKIIPAAFLIGIASIYLSYYFSEQVLMILPIFALVFAFVFKFIFKRKVGVFLLCVLWALILALSTVSAIGNFDSVLAKFSGDNCRVYGKITFVAGENEYFDGYIIKIDRIVDDSGEVWNTDEECELLIRNGKNELTLSYGDYISAVADIDEVSAPGNTGETDYGLADKADGVFYTLVADEGETQVLKKFTKVRNIEDAAYVVREYIREVSFDMLSERNAAFLMGVLVSENRYLDAETHEVLENAGLMHLSVASGLHVGCIVTVITMALGLIFIRKKRAMLFSIPIIIFYIFINGGSVSIIRASLMMFMVILSNQLKRDYDNIISLCFAGLVIILVNPLSLFDVSFILSFGAVAAIFFWADVLIGTANKITVSRETQRALKKYHLRGLVEYIKISVCVCVALQLVITPLNAYFFGYVTPYSIISNILVTWMLPYIMLLAVLMLIFAFFTPVCSIFAFCLNIVIGAVLGIAKGVSSLPLSRVNVYMSFTAVVFTLLTLCGVYFCIKKKLKLACIAGIICALIITGSVAAKIAELTKIEITFVNVGQGDGAFIKYGNGKALVIDSAYSGEEDYVFGPYLQRSGVKSIECIFVSHFDSDHAGNVLNILEDFEVKNIALPIRDKKSELQLLIEEKAREKGTYILYVKSGDEIKISDEINVKIYMPTPETSRSYAENEGSMVMKVEASDKSVLFLGDLPAEIQTSVAQKYKDELECDILKVSHHGSADGYSAELIQTAKPQYAVISCGEQNIYNHPDSTVVRRLNAAGVRTFITSENGDVRFSADRRAGKYMSVKCNNE